MPIDDAHLEGFFFLCLLRFVPLLAQPSLRIYPTQADPIRVKQSTVC